MPLLVRGRSIAIVLLLAAGAHGAGTRPNVLLLVAEDMSPRLGAFGDPLARTPNLDALAAQGLRFTNAFTTAGVCAPSRAALITGMYQMAIGAQHMRAGSFPGGGYASVPPPPVKAFPELLRAAGYYTFTDEKLDYQFSGPLAGSGPFTVWDAEGYGERKNLWRNRAPGQAFFGLINFQVTHESGTFAPLGSWPHSPVHLAMQLARAWMIGRVPEEMIPDPGTLSLPPYYPDIPSVRREMARHYGNIRFMDAQVGEILRALEREGLAGNTIVIWTSDHGDGLPRAKREVFDSGIHVPMIVRWPDRWRPADIEAGSADPRLLSFVDLAPTILGLAGEPVPDWMHGHDIFAAGTAAREYVFAARDRMDEVTDRQRAVRDLRFKYIRSGYPEQPGGRGLSYRDNQEMVRDMRAMWRAGRLNPPQARWFEPPGAEQLYDLGCDPFELHNLAGDSDYRGELLRLRAALDAWLSEVHDTSGVPEADMAAGFLCAGERCRTPPPRLRFAGDRVAISADTPGASLGYRLDEGPWRLYTAPFANAGAGRVSAKAVRYGWEESEAVETELR